MYVFIRERERERLSFLAVFLFICSTDGLLLFIRVNPWEPAATARRPLGIGVLAKSVAERLVH